MRRVFASFCVSLVVIGSIDCSGDAAALDRAPVLQPGSGWTEETAEPAPIGRPTARGYDAKAIARFDVVPYQTFRKEFSVGVVAFHMNQIDRVEFAVDGGPWAAVDKMTLNPRTGVWEYWITLDATTFPEDGPVEVRAVAYPKCGEPRVLQPATGHPLVLYANARGTLANTDVTVHVSPKDGDDGSRTGSVTAPFRTLFKAITFLNETQQSCGGATICLDEGVYTYPEDLGQDGARDRWLTLTAASGVARENVVFSGKGAGVLQRKLHLKHLTINHSVEDAAPLRRRSSPYGNEFWVDGCELFGRGYRDEDLSRSGFVEGRSYYTDCLWHDNKVALAGPIVRNIQAYNIAGDFLGRQGLFVNCHLRHMRRAKGVHPDVYQIFGGEVENVIIYGLKASDVVSQGINIGQGASRVEDIAIVNCLIEQVPNHASRNFLPAAQAGNANHVVLWHNSYIGISTADSYCGQKNLDAVGCVFAGFSHDKDGDTSGWRFDHNHFARADQIFGSSATSGAPQWARPAVWEEQKQTLAGDYRPGPNSPLDGRIQEPLVPIDVDGNVRRFPTAAGALVGATESQRP